ncbi:MAG: noncanonical pyrimidine nucleotidase, YjjG family [Bacteroidales bacterium 45-6]|nr:MAG: noncanonical pyrimidine nucleotidase, YjjG family [Bacteroidales bacterium 45-6]
MKYSTVLIDIDDTIWDTRNNSREAFLEMYESHRWDVYFESFDHFYDAYLPSNIELWSLYAQGKIKKEELIVQRFVNPLSPHMPMDATHALKLNDELLERVSEKTKLVENAKELLDYLSPKYQLVILSNGFREVQYKKLRNSNIDKYFEHVILSDEAGVNKPHPGIFSKALKAANSNGKNTVMLGDSFESDISGAHNSGIDQIWFNPEAVVPENFTPTFIVENLEEVKSIL